MDSCLGVLKGMMDEVVRRPLICAMHVCVADLETSGMRSAEQQEREDNYVPRWVILVEGSTSEAVNKVLAGPLGKEAMPKVDNLAFSTYALQYDLLNDLRPA